MGNSLANHRPLRVMFVNTSMPVGGAEMLQVELLRHFDRSRILPEVCCLKERGPLGEMLANEVPVHANLIRSKYDLWVVRRLSRLFRERQIDAMVTVGAGDKMFWGRLAARASRVPVVVSALHSTGWPDGVGRLNRLLTPMTDAFIAVAETHGRFLIEQAKFPASKVRVIHNGVDTERFAPTPGSRALRAALEIGPADPVVGIVAALRPEKNHELFLAAARLTLQTVSDAKFLIVGDGPERCKLKRLARPIQHAVRFAGTRDDVPQLLNLMNVFALTSHNEANPVSILEAMAVGKPVVATRVGSVEDTVQNGTTGYVVSPGDPCALADRWCDLIQHPLTCRAMGARGRQLVVQQWSLSGMVRGYEDLLARLFKSALDAPARPRRVASDNRRIRKNLTDLGR